MADEEKRYSEYAENLHREISRAYFLEGPKAALKQVTVLLKSDHRLSPEEVERFKEIKTYYINVVNPKYLPPRHPTSEEIAPLWAKTYSSRKTEQTDAERLGWAWKYLEYSTPGTDEFLNALSNLADVAAGMNLFTLAKSATETFLSFSQLMDCANAKELIPNGGYVATRPLDWIGYRSVYSPWWAALKGIYVVPDSCWATMLEWFVYEDETRKDWGYRKSVESLIRYCEGIGDRKSVLRIQRDHPLASENAGKPDDSSQETAQ